MRNPSSSSSSSSSSANTTGTIPFAVHSTYRHERTGEPLRPVGLQWNLPGESHVTFVPLPPTSAAGSSSSSLIGRDAALAVRRGLVEAYNRWTFARGESFASVDDIQSVIVVSDAVVEHQHVTVTWKDTLRKRLFREESLGSNVADLLRNESAAQQDGGETVEVWINGRFVGDLCGPESLCTISQALSAVTSRRLAYKRCDAGKFVRIERYFGGYLRQQNEIFDHIMDNLIAMEDVEIIDEQTLIGHATLCDWIMGGEYCTVMQCENATTYVTPVFSSHTCVISLAQERLQAACGSVKWTIASVFSGHCIMMTFRRRIVNLT